MLNFSKLLYQRGATNDTFENQILPDEDKVKHLQSCIKKIRDYVRPRVAEATVNKLGMEHPVIPRFRTQGSWSYNTCVVPAQTPPQEMDWDFGIYLPVTVWEENGPPHSMAKAYFDLVEELLGDLCRQERWTLIVGKDTCIRIQVSKAAHIDLPLYAAPEAEFKKIVESVALAKASATYDSIKMESADFSEAAMEVQWDDLDCIVMATRKGEWWRSDPQSVANWFKDRIDEHGPQLRRTCRYLKAWRDHHWPKGGPTSVSIMIAVAQGFEVHADRDDLALENAARRLSIAFTKEIREKGIDNEAEDFNRLSEEERRDTGHRFGALAVALCGARAASLVDKETVITRLRAQFGPRVPNDLGRVVAETGADMVRNTPATRVAAPVVNSSKSG